MNLFSFMNYKLLEHGGDAFFFKLKKEKKERKKK